MTGWGDVDSILSRLTELEARVAALEKPPVAPSTPPVAPPALSEEP